ncbi:MAG TPA: carbonic anhydrase [Gammaproteobacteria bacterium]|nr:carbonic anhydrase [Gammaproteobacteria bacterium]
MKIYHTILFTFLICCQSPVMAYSQINSPKEALQLLMEGNERFVNDKSHNADRNQDRRAAISAKQKPFAVVLGCSDSRVPPELAFDQGLGDIFTVRVAGNVVGATELESVAYSAIYNGSAIIMVLGHENCGAVAAVLAHTTQDIPAIAKLIKPAVNTKNDTMSAAVKANVYKNVMRIKQSPSIAKLIKAGKVDVVGALYDLDTGKVQLLPEQE